MLSAYVINLDRSPERLEKFNQHPDSIYFTRFLAVDKAWFAHIPHVDSLLFDNTYIAQKYNRNNITLGEICCTLSHIGCWKKIAEDYSLEDQQYAVVAEDDVVLTPNFAQQVVKLAKDMENRPIQHYFTP